MRYIISIIFSFISFDIAYGQTFDPNNASSNISICGGNIAVVGSCGFLDSYPGATWGFSTYKLKNSYTGNWGTVQRQSDDKQQVIGFVANGKADVATFNTFCANTNCYAASIVDHVNAINPVQATLANMPRTIVDANNVLAVCPQPGSKMTTSYNALVNTTQQHIFTVAKPGFADSRYSQADVATTTVTGNITMGSASVTSMSSQVGLSTTGGNSAFQTRPGVVDANGSLPNAPTVGTVGSTYLSALPTGTTGTLGFATSNTPLSSQTADPLTFTNAVTQGAWIINGPASATWVSSAYWGMGVDAVGFGAGTMSFTRNASAITYQSFIGNGMRGQWGVYDYDTPTAKLSYNGVDLGNTGVTGGNITYSTNVGMTLFSNANGTENASNNCFETMVLFPSTQSSRVVMAQFLMSQDGISFPFAPATSDGFTMTGIYQPLDSFATSSVYGQGQTQYGPDAWGMTWIAENGGYTWPSVARANNINNSTTMWRFIVHQGDSDMNINLSERSELDLTTTSVVPGQDWSQFYQVQFDALPTQNGDWCFGGQIHYNDVSTTAPDLLTWSCKGGQFQFITQKGSGPTNTNCGTAQTLTVGTTYAVIVTGHWSTNHTSDTLTINFGPNSVTPIPQLCNVSGALWDNDTGAHMKMGLYRGFPWANAGTAIVRYMNGQWSNTANAYSSYITTPPALPTHP